MHATAHGIYSAQSTTTTVLMTIIISIRSTVGPMACACVREEEGEPRADDEQGECKFFNFSFLGAYFVHKR